MGVAGRASTSTTTTAPNSTCAARGRDTATRTTNALGTWRVAKTTVKTLETMQTRLRIAATRLTQVLMMMMIRMMVILEVLGVLEVLQVVDLEVAVATVILLDPPIVNAMGFAFVPGSLGPLYEFVMNLLRPSKVSFLDK